MRILTLVFLGCFLWSGVGKGEVKTPVLAIANLTDPAKLATLKGERAANPRLQKCVYWLATAEAAGELPEAILDEAAKLNNTDGTPYARFLRWGLIENLRIAKKLGLLSPEGMAELRQGNPATITKGEYAGKKAEAEHVIPRAICPELENQVLNLELLLASQNPSNSRTVSERQRVFSFELYKAKLLSEEGFVIVEFFTNPDLQNFSQGIQVTRGKVFLGHKKLAEILEMLKNGQLSLEDFFYDERKGEWLPIKSISFRALPRRSEPKTTK